jgi:hypothetical protein
MERVVAGDPPAGQRMTIQDDAVVYLKDVDLKNPWHFAPSDFRHFAGESPAATHTNTCDT